MRELTDFYDLLTEAGVCRSEQDFSIRWLGKSKTYAACLRSTGSPPSIEALVHLSAKLINISGGLLASKAPTADLRATADRMREAGNEALSLAFDNALSTPAFLEQGVALRESDPEQMKQRAKVQRDSAKRLEKQAEIQSLRDRMQSQQRALAKVVPTRSSS